MSTKSLEPTTRGRRFDAASWPPHRSSGIAKVIAPVVTLVALACSALPAAAQFLQQGQKLIGTGAIHGAHGASQGDSVALSSDGNTALVGGASDDSVAGAVWIFTRSDGVWSQQGSKLVGTGAIKGPYSPAQGTSVALSGDGNTALVGGPTDNNGVGAVWVFTRSDGAWSQQGSKLVGTGAVGGGQHQGQSVALSADGNTALVGGPADSYGDGAVWVFTRSGGVWTQQGSKLVGTGATGHAFQGTSVALSADGKTALVGGPHDNPGGTTPGPGAVWVFSRSGGVWSQQGLKLVGTGAIGNVQQGKSVALSGDGNTALVGGQYDNSKAGAAWVFTRSGGAWTQQGSKLVGIGGLAYAEQGQSVALSSDGNTALVGGHLGDGAVWVFTRSDGVWSQQGSKLVGAGASGQASQGTAVALSADGKTALVGGAYDNSGTGAAWVFVSGVKLQDAAATPGTAEDISPYVLGERIAAFEKHFENTTFGLHVTLGRASEILPSLQHGVDLTLDPTLGKPGRFTPNVARWGGSRLLNFSVVNHLLSVRSLSVGSFDDEVTIWHEYLHLLVRLTAPQDCGPEETYMELAEDRVRWLNSLLSFDRDFKNGSATKTQLRAMWKTREDRWNAAFQWKDGFKNNLSGPFKWQDAEGDSTCGKGGAFYTIDRNYIQRLDAMLGIDIDINKIRMAYNSIFEDDKWDLAKIEVNRSFPTTRWQSPGVEVIELVGGSGTSVVGAGERTFKLGWTLTFASGKGFSNAQAQVTLTEVPTSLVAPADNTSLATFAAKMIGRWDMKGFGFARDHTIELSGAVGSAKWSELGEPSEPVTSKIIAASESSRIAEPKLAEINNDRVIVVHARINFGDDNWADMDIRLIYARVI